MLLIALDQLTKIWALGYSFFVVNNHIYLNYGEYNYTWYVLWLAFIVVITMLVVKNLKKSVSWFLLFMLSGAISNMFDRLYHGGVVDFIKIGRVDIIFNLADLYILIGAAACFVIFVKNKKAA